YEFADPSISTRIDSTELDSTQRMHSNFADLNHRAFNARPDYLAAKENLSATESSVSQSRSGYFPTITGSAGYNLSSHEYSTISDNSTLGWGLNFRWNIFDAFRTN